MVSTMEMYTIIFCITNTLDETKFEMYVPGLEFEATWSDTYTPKR